MSPQLQERPASQWERLFKLVEGQAGLIFSEGRCRSAMDAVEGILESKAIANPDHLVDLAAKDPDLLHTIVSALTIGETYFFRDPKHFETIQKVLIPDVLSHARPGRRLRCWSAGCSTGEEAYSLALMLHEMKLGDRSEVIGTDLAENSIQIARKGVYRRWSFRTGDSQRMKPHVHPVDNDSEQLEIAPWLRKRVLFRTLNLISPELSRNNSSLYPMDIILCRNVLIYLSASAIHRVAQGLFATLAPGGYLVTGPSDPFLPLQSEISTKNHSGVRIYQKILSLAREPKSLGVSTGNSQPSLSRNSDGKETNYFGAEAEAKPKFDKIGSPESIVDKRNKDEGESELLQSLLKTANQSATRGIAACRQVLQNRPYCPKLNYLLGVLLMHEGQYDDSQTALRRALYLDPNLAIASYALANLLALQGDQEGAKRCLRNIVNDGRRIEVGGSYPSFECKDVQDLVQTATEQLEVLLQKGQCS